ncbi:hypothetical protein [Caulobacter sp. CCG-8]|uniref:hypothetical protein n=1 Tax=Caulobacter sp. CCG-8 TaxID=3127958 RepID=UPI00307EDDD1
MRKPAPIIPVLLGLALLSLSSPAPAQGPFRTEQVRFAKGASSATVNGAIKADGGVSYALTVRAGQTLKVSLRTRNASARFNVIAPGVDQPLFNGSNARDYAGKTPVAGAYRIIVYMTEDAAMRNETADYVLTIGVTG